MQLKLGNIFAFVAVAFLIVVGNADKLTEEECTKLGFNKAELWCDRCSELRKFELDELKPSCLQCCRDDDKSAKKVCLISNFQLTLIYNFCTYLQKYAFARLEYCECNINNFNQVKAFIRSDMSKKFSNLKIKFVRGITPILKLLDANHNVVDELNIQKWDTDTIEEFLHERLA